MKQNFKNLVFKIIFSNSKFKQKIVLPSDLNFGGPWFYQLHLAFIFFK